MAFADLNFTAALWRGRGLAWLAAGADLPPGLSLTAGPDAPLSQPAPATPREPRATGRAGSRPQAGAGRASVPQASQAGPGARWQPLAAGALPREWRERLSATRAGLVAWTYWDLAQDLAAGASGPAGGAEEDAAAQLRAARRAFLGRLLRELAHPAGTHTFWPACLAGAEGAPFAAHPEAFWSGAALLGCRAVIVMGSAAVRALELPPGLRPLGQVRWRGQLVLVLREVDSLARDPARFGPTLAFLRQALGPVARPAR